MAFLMGARPDEVQDAIGYTDDQWHRFYMVTRNEAKTLLNQHAWRSYTEIPANERTILLKRVNDTLSAEDIPEVSAKALRWRMTNLIRDFKKKLAHSSTELFTTPAEPLSSHPTTIMTTTTKRIPYDPVRDL